MAEQINRCPCTFRGIHVHHVRALYMDHLFLPRAQEMAMVTQFLNVRAKMHIPMNAMRRGTVVKLPIMDSRAFSCEKGFQPLHTFGLTRKQVGETRMPHSFFKQLAVTAGWIVDS